MDLIRLLKAELLKLKRSLILLVIFAIPGMMFLITVMTISTNNSSGIWYSTAVGATGIWSFFMLPMSVTALTALQAQIEHGSRAWSYSLAVPYRKWRIFTVKFAVILLATLLMSALVVLAVIVGGMLAGWMTPEYALKGDIPLKTMWNVMLLMWLASVLVTAIQFAVATVNESFAIPVVVGIGGTFVAIVATGAEAGVYFPWLLPTNVLASELARFNQALLTGCLGGLLVFAIACYYMVRRDWK